MSGHDSADGAQKRLERLAQVLLAFADGDKLRREIAERTGFGMDVASKSLDNAVSLGYVEKTTRRDGLHWYYRLTPRGLAKLPAYSALQMQRTPAEEALAAVEALPAGMTSLDLAAQLGISMELVDEFLAPHVAPHRLVSCATKRMVNGELLAMTSYRASSAGSMSRNDVRMPEAAAPARAAEAAPATAVADELVEAAREPAPAAPGPIELPVFECDIDAVHRKLQRGAAVSPAPGQDDLVHDFLAALYSDGVLWLQLEDGRQFDLQPDETRALFRYLDRLAGTALVEALPCA